MTVSADKMQGYLMIAAGAVAVYAAWRIYKVGENAADSVGRSLDNVSAFVGGAVDAVASIPQTAYAGVTEFFNFGPPIGGTPDSLSGIGSMADAQNLARGIDNWYATRDEAYDLVASGGYFYDGYTRNMSVQSIVD